MRHAPLIADRTFLVAEFLGPYLYRYGYLERLFNDTEYQAKCKERTSPNTL
jgi:hypothetical protein